MPMCSRYKMLLTSQFFTIPLFIFGQKEVDVQTIVDRSIKVHGGDIVKNSIFSFDFRKYHLTYERNEGAYTYTRTHKETGLTDVLNNEGIKRFKNQEEILLNSKNQKRYGNSLNSVIYFAFLPYFLIDVAVQKELLAEVIIQGNNYYKLRVTFIKEGGGDDFEDEYFYWINKKTFRMDYLAYSFHINGGGVRFREAYNTRNVGGVLFQDYINYKHDKNTPVGTLDALFEKGELKELSRIVLENVKMLY